MKKICISLLTLFAATSAYAQSGIDAASIKNHLTGLGMSAELSAYVAGGLGVTDSSGNGNINVATGKSFKVNVAKTPAYTFDATKLLMGNNGVIAAPTSVAVSAGAANTPNYTFNATSLTIVGADVIFSTAGKQDKFPAGVVITPSTTYPTPNAGDTVSNRFNLIAAAAPTATFVELPAATSNVGKTFSTYNQAAANPAAIVPQGGDSLNLVAAGTPFACTTGKWCECTAVSSSLYQCHQS